MRRKGRDAPVRNSSSWPESGGGTWKREDFRAVELGGHPDGRLEESRGH